MTDDATLGDVMREIRATRAAVGRLAALVEQSGRRQSGSNPTIALLLPEIYDALGDEVFALVDLAALGAMPSHDALGRALAPRLGRDGGLRSLGRAMARCAGQNLGGLELRQVGQCRDGSLWQIVTC